MIKSFIIQIDNDILPIEVKSDENVESRSLKIYGEKYAETTRMRICFSMKNLKLDGNVLNIPLFMAEYTEQLLRVTEKLKKNSENVIFRRITLQ